MEIQYLKLLSDTPTFKEASGYVKYLESIDEIEIGNLENTYNYGKPFPKALKELLFLAGKYFYVLDYNSYSQDEMQLKQREFLAKRGKSITKPFFVIDVYNVGSQFLFVYLDEGQDPTVYAAILYRNTSDWLYSLNQTLSQFIDQGLIALFRGENPFNQSSVSSQTTEGCFENIHSNWRILYSLSYPVTFEYSVPAGVFQRKSCVARNNVNDFS